MLRFSPWLPDPDEASDLVGRELSDPKYAQAEPTWWDKLVSSVFNFFGSLFDPNIVGNAGPIIGWVLAGILIVVLVLAIIVWGRPRLLRTTQIARGGAMFGEDESRTADQLRAAAAERASRGDFDAAVVLQTKALARALHERGIVVLPVGATVQQFAAHASTSFPSAGSEFAMIAGTFDRVRYVRQHASADDYQRVRALDVAVSHQRPAALSDLSLVAPR